MARLTEELLAALEAQLRRDEGCKQYPYTDTTGHISIGVGRNLTDRGVSYETIQQMLEEDMIAAYADMLDVFGASRIHEWADARKLAVMNMLFNLGRDRFLGFRKMIAAIKADNWRLAAVEAMDSRWAHQVGERAVRISNMLRTGELV